MHVKKMLIARGYWKAAGEGEGGSGGGSGDGTGAGGEGGAGSGSNDGGKGDESGSEGEGDGKSGTKKPTDEEAKLLKEVMEKKGKIQELSAALDQVKGQLKAFEGLDPEQVKKLLKEVSDRQTAELEAKGNWDALKKQLLDAHGVELGTKAKELKDAVEKASALEGKIAELTVGNAFGTSKFIVDEMALPISKVRSLFGSHFEFDGEKVVGYDKPAGSKGRTLLIDGKGDALSFEAALEKLVDADPDADSLRKSKMKQGAGSGTETRGKAGVTKVEVTGIGRIAQALSAQKK